MNFKKLAISTVIVTSFLIGAPLSFGQVTAIELEEAIALSKENSAVIRELKNQEFSVKNSIRENTQKSYMVTNSLDSYYNYINTYEDAVASNNHPLNKYIGRSNDYLETTLMTLGNQLGAALAINNEKTAEQIQDTMDFIGAYMQFGDTAGLTKETKYTLFKKNEAMLANSIDLIETKYAQGLIAADKGTEAGTIKLYIGLRDLGQGLALKKELLNIHETALINMQSSFKQGLISRIALDNQKKTTQMERLSVQNMQYQYDNLLYQFNKMCGLPLDTDTKLSTSFNNVEFIPSLPSSYYEIAYGNNMDYLVLKSELEYNEKNFAVMNKYLIDIDKDTDQIIYYQEKEDMKDTLNDLNDKILNKQLEIQNNIHYAYNDLQYKKKLVEHGNTALELAALQLQSGQQSYNLGQITQVKFDEIKLNFENTAFSVSQNKRAFNTAVEHFDLLINYGVAYE